MIVLLVFLIALIAFPVQAQTIPEITWSNSRTGTSGNATGTLPNWTVANIALLSGTNPIMVTYTTANGTAQDSITVTYAPTFPGNTLAGAWAFDAGSGSTAADSSGNGNTGNLLNAPTWTQGKYNTGLLFNSINSQNVIVGDANSLDWTQSFTISAWVMPNTVHSDFRAVAVKDYVIALYASQPGGSGCASGVPMIWFETNGTLGPSYRACGSAPLAIGQWTHLAGTYDGSNLKLYVNGVLIATTAASGYIEQTTGSLRIGASQFGEYFDGAIDEVRGRNYAVALTGGGNTTLGAVCNYADSVNVSTASIIGDANCPIISPVPPSHPIMLGVSATSFKIGAGATALKLGANP